MQPPGEDEALKQTVRDAQTAGGRVDAAAVNGRLRRRRGGCVGAEGGRDREQSRSNSPFSAALQAPALPYTSGAYLGNATATLLLLLLPFGGVEEPAAKVRARATRVQVDCSSVACAISRTRS